MTTSYSIDAAKSWPEDNKDGESGDYENICLECQSHFLGHKRRLFCKQCVNKPKNEHDSRTK